MVYYLKQPPQIYGHPDLSNFQRTLAFLRIYFSTFLKTCKQELPVPDLLLS